MHMYHVSMLAGVKITSLNNFLIFVLLGQDHLKALAILLIVLGVLERAR